VEENTAITRFESAQLSKPSFSPTTFAEAIKFSEIIANSDLAPKDFRGKPDNVLVAIQMGSELGLAPLQALQNIAVINGRPCVWGDAALAIVQGHPAYELHREFMEGEGDAKTAVFQIKRRGQEIHESRFSLADARRAGLLDKKPSPWQTYPERMLQMRARNYGLRDKFADALRGIAPAEEYLDAPAPMPPISASQTSQALPASTTQQKTASSEQGQDTRLITEGQRKRLFAMAHEYKWPEDHLRNLLARFGFEHSTEVTKEKYDEICRLIEQRPQNSK
jgi:hypothetical protein